ncbi:MAG: hypothetical protein D6796_12300 [Caldilineae bacterium]|nr:MAG: hypothetical protein D6796_12300 [Caldilineae bacterium]
MRGEGDGLVEANAGYIGAGGQGEDGGQGGAGGDGVHNPQGANAGGLPGGFGVCQREPHPGLARFGGGLQGAEEGFSPRKGAPQPAGGGQVGAGGHLHQHGNHPPPFDQLLEEAGVNLRPHRRRKGGWGRLLRPEQRQAGQRQQQGEQQQKGKTAET